MHLLKNMVMMLEKIVEIKKIFNKLIGGGRDKILKLSKKN